MNMRRKIIPKNMESAFQNLTIVRKKIFGVLLIIKFSLYESLC